MSLAGKPRKIYSAEFRAKSAQLCNEKGYTIDQVAAQLGCCRESVRRWKEAAKAKLALHVRLQLPVFEVRR